MIVGVVLVALFPLVGPAGAAAIVPGTYSLWSPTTVPVRHTEANDTGSIELGVRFRSDVSGSVSAVRFYKGPTNTGTHIGNLWTAGGTRLASVTFSGETASGWQQATFARPVPVKAGVTYVASYFAPRGQYAQDDYWFSGRSARNGPLRAPASTQSNPNGVYRYGSTSRFPNQTYRAANFWVDVVFTTSGFTPPTTQPPTTVTTAPATTTTTVAPTTTTTQPPTTTTTVAPPTTTTTRPPVSGVAYGWQLNAGNTGLAGAGVDRNSLPVYSGAITAGMTLSKVKITRGVDLTNVPNVTLDRVLLQPSGTNRALMLGPGTVIKDSDIDGISMPNGERWGISSGTGSGTTGNYTIQRVQITHVSIGMWLDSANSSSSGTVSDTYVHDLISTNGAHVDGFTRRGGTGPVTILRSRIAVDYSDGGGSHATGAVFLQNTWGGQIGGVTVQDTYLEGNGFNMVLENKGAGTSLAVNNVRVRPTEYGAVTRSGVVNLTQWANVYHYSATAANNAGTAVPRP